ncbi:MAG: hypothetical protein HFH60_11065 [Lachnospiraceae bacterium]|nr:hypothetical protein [Lachnospiraceae bacterium]MCI9547209.1 hypothetical protein [Lachnospiraceae bacterium]
METRNTPTDDENQYTCTYKYKCPNDSTEATHTILYKKATCTRVDDVILHFHCSRDSGCVKCQQNYL